MLLTRTFAINRFIREAVRPRRRAAPIEPSSWRGSSTRSAQRAAGRRVPSSTGGSIPHARASLTDSAAAADRRRGPGGRTGSRRRSRTGSRPRRRSREEPCIPGRTAGSRFRIPGTVPCRPGTVDRPRGDCGRDMVTSSSSASEPSDVWCLRRGQISIFASQGSEFSARKSRADPGLLISGPQKSRSDPGRLISGPVGAVRRALRGDSR